MYHRLPIVAYANTAVPETVQGAGLVLPDKEPARVAAAIDRVLRDEHLRAVLAEAASERVETFALPRVRAGFATALDAACAV
jgi:glycosyltransferase involved in cell wall biosynthesis